MSANLVATARSIKIYDLALCPLLLLSKHALRTSERLNIPSDRLIEMGVYREI